MSEAYHCDEDDALEILKRIPNNPSTMPVRHWVTGSLPSEHLGIDDCIEAMLWSDHGVVLRATEGHIADRIYYVDHHGDLRAMSEEGLDVESPNEAAVMLDSDLDADGIDVVAVLAEDAPEPARSVGKEIVTDGGQLGVECDVDDCDSRVVGLDDGWEYARGTVCQSCIDYRDRHNHWPDESLDICVECRVDDGMIKHDCEQSPADAVLIEPGNKCSYCDFEAAITDGGERVSDPGARVYCPACKSWNSHDDGDCSICGGPIKQVATDGGRPPLRRCSDCGLIHRPTEACRAVNGGGDR